MKKNLMKTMLAIAVLLVGSASVNAKSWRVNPNVNMKANFTDINAAMASADVVAGDTLYLDPGCTITTEQTISKEVVVVGTGFFFTDQPHSEAKIAAALNIAAANAKVEGLYITGETRVKASYVTLERCRMGAITTQGTCMNATIRQCHIEASYTITGRGKTSNESANWVIENCLVRCTERGGARAIRDLYNVTLKNNFIINSCYDGWSDKSAGYCIGDCSNIVLQNNVIMAIYYYDRIFYSCSNYSCTGNVFSCPESSLSSFAENNVFLASNNQALVFNTSKPNDLWLELCEESRAKGVGVDGVDAGPRGGNYPYVFSGYPQGRPYFKAATVSPVAKDGKVSVKLNLKMQDE